jgi:hypothetical protein
MKRLTIAGLGPWIVIAFSATSALSQPAPIPHHVEPYVLDTGRHDGRAEAAIESRAAVREVVEIPDVPWMRLHVAAHALGSDSFVTFTSLLDGGQQRLDAESLADYDYGTAYFNGDAVAVELHVAPEAQGVFLRIEEVTVGEWVGGQPIVRSLCGPDDRVQSTDRRSGRVVPSGCTGWIVSNNGYIMAGHCVGGSSTTLEFQVPSSLCDGTVQFAHPDDQYAIDRGNEVWAASGVGDDFAVFDTAPNSNTGLLAIHSQDDFFRMSRDTAPTTIRITGYGLDNTPVGCDNGRNEDSQTEQTNAGPFLNEVVQGPADVYLEYIVDTTGGNSGSPVIVEGTADIAVGVHTHGGCSPPSGGNFGTSFENNDFEDAVDGFLGTNVVYVDTGHPGTNEVGNVLRPYGTVAEGVAAVAGGGTVAIVEGTYGETLFIDSAMTLKATAGRVTIGQ